jgi:hypothetical protein
MRLSLVARARTDLIRAAFEATMTACAELAGEALAAPEPWPA